MPSINPNSSQSGPHHGMEMGSGESSPHSHHPAMSHLDPSGRQDGQPDHNMMGYGGGGGGGGYPGFGAPAQQGQYGGGGGAHQSYVGPYPPGFGGSAPPYGNPIYGGSGASGGGSSQPYAYVSYGGPPPTGRGGPSQPHSWYGYNPASGGPPELPHSRMMPPSGGFPTQQQVLPSQQQQQSSRSTRGGRAMAGKLPFAPSKVVREGKSISPDKSEVLAKENKPGDNAATTRSSTSKMDDLEAERMKNAEQAELSLQEVKPIQTDFHFFVLDMRDKLRKMAEEEVRKSTKKPKGDELNSFLVNSNLNARLMKAWEDLPEEERDAYVQKEEQDRRRFMEEDEVASRHCFTLTARLRADMKKQDGSSEEKPELSPSSATGGKDEKQASLEEIPSAPKEETSETESTKLEAFPETKRSQEGETTENSPPKKTKVDEES